MAYLLKSNITGKYLSEPTEQEHEKQFQAKKIGIGCFMFMTKERAEEKALELGATIREINWSDKDN